MTIANKIIIFLSIIFISINSVSDTIRESKQYQDLHLPYYAGTCKGDSGDIYLNEALNVNNSLVKVRREKGFNVLKIVRDMLDITVFDENAEIIESYRIEVKKEIIRNLKKLSDIDISVSFVVVEGKLGIYWKESFLHRPYNQGVFLFSEGKLTWYCHGAGGFNTSH